MFNQNALRGIAVAVFALLMIPGLSFANSAGTWNSIFGTQRPVLTQAFLQLEYSDASCYTNFTSTYGSFVVNVTGNSSISTQVSVLQGDTTQLQSYYTSNNTIGFRTYLSSTYRPQLKLTVKTIKNSITAADLNASQKASVAAEYSTAKTALSQCKFNSLKQFATIKVGLYNSSLSYYQNLSTQLSANGLNVSNLNQLINGSENAIINPLGIAINGAQNITQLKHALGSFCLYNGCANGINYHMAAHFAVNALTDKATYLSSNSAFTNNTILIRADQHLSISNSALGLVGSHVYVNGQGRLVWSNIRDAARLIHQLWK